MQTELHHSNNPPEIQEAIDESKLVEWLTLQDERRANRVLDPREAALVRKRKPDRIMSSRFVITQEHEDGNTRMKSRWCLRGHHDPDLMEKVAAGKCQSLTLAQMNKNMLLQVLASCQWEMNLGDILEFSTLRILSPRRFHITSIARPPLRRKSLRWEQSMEL